MSRAAARVATPRPRLILSRKWDAIARSSSWARPRPRGGGSHGPVAPDPAWDRDGDAADPAFAPDPRPRGEGCDIHNPGDCIDRPAGQRSGGARRRAPVQGDGEDRPDQIQDPVLLAGAARE